MLKPKRNVAQRTEHTPYDIHVMLEYLCVLAASVRARDVENNFQPKAISIPIGRTEHE